MLKKHTSKRSGIAILNPRTFIALKFALSPMLFGVALPVLAQYSPPTAGLVAWWRADGNANDSADSHNGTLEGGMGFTSGVFGQAFYGDSRQRVFVPDSTAFQLTSSLTIGAWVNVRADSWDVLFRGDNRTGLDPYQLAMDNAGHIGLVIEDGVGGVKSLYAPIPYHQWVQVTATLDGTTGDMRVYLNGVLAAEDSTAIRPLGPLDPTQHPGIGIGNVQDFYDFPFLGAIDEVVLYSRALSPSEVVSLVPEPASVTLLCCGLGVGLISAFRRRRTGQALSFDPKRTGVAVHRGRIGWASRYHFEIFFSSAVVDFPGTKGMMTIRPPACSTVRRSS